MQEHNSTPLAQRIASVRSYDDDSPWDVERLELALNHELERGIIDGVPQLVNIIFPDNRLPFPVDDIFMQKLRVTFAQGRALQVPTQNEKECADWLGYVSSVLEELTKLPVRRRWVYTGCNKPVAGSPTLRKPDLMLVDVDQDDVNWATIHALGEVTASSDSHHRITATTKQKAFLVFSCQSDRRFTLSLEFVKSRFRFTVCDRTGMLISVPYNSDIRNITLVRVLAGLMYASDAAIGLDPTMHRGPDGPIRSITVLGLEYTVMKKIFSAETLRGRATQCWHVRRDGKEYVLKDCWRLRSRVLDEVQILQGLTGVQGVPRLIASEDVQCFGAADSTATRRPGLDFEEERLHRRLVIEPLAQPLYTFTSRRELIQAFIDVVEGTSQSLVACLPTMNL